MADYMSTPYLALTSAQQLWNQWEIQCLLVASFTLQVFLLFFSGIRKRHGSRVLGFLLWLAYLLADYVATYALGRLTLHLNDPRHQLVLFWTPFLLLHLGGQETIAAFSTEDSMLWKRHLLSLVSQVTLAVYIVAKSWPHSLGGGSRQLVAPMALMFIAGTIKYTERAWALMAAGNAMTPGSSSITDRVLHVEGSVIDEAKSYFRRLNEVVSKADRDGKLDYEGVVAVAGKGLRMCVEFLTDMTPFLMWHSGDIIDRAINNLQDLRNKQLRAQIAYKLAEIHLWLIYDFFYTKYGVLQFHMSQVNSGLERLVTFGATSTALALFLNAHLNGHFSNLSRADVMVSYVLLIGAVALDLSSILMLISSYWPHLPGRGPFGDGLFPSGKSALFSVTRFANPLDKALWSGKMAQYNLIHGCIQEKKANMLMRCMRKLDLVSDVTRTLVSPELKEFLFNKILAIATTRHVNEYWKWDFSTFRGQWLRWELEDTEEGRSVDQKLLHIDDGHFAGIVLMWHITTEMCFYTDDNKAGNPPPCRAMSRDLSNYIMYLIAKRGVKSGSNGYFELGKVRRDVRKALSHERFARGHLNQRSVVLYGYEGHGYFSARASAAAKELLKITCPAQRWELIATVWVEMLCYLAPNCDTGFHIKSLSTGSEFISQVRILLISLGIPFLREPWQAEAKDDPEYSDFIMF